MTELPRDPFGPLNTLLGYVIAILAIVMLVCAISCNLLAAIARAGYKHGTQSGGPGNVCSRAPVGGEADVSPKGLVATTAASKKRASMRLPTSGGASGNRDRLC